MAGCPHNNEDTQTGIWLHKSVRELRDTSLVVNAMGFTPRFAPRRGKTDDPSEGQ
jgi:hypothetical protein